MSYLVLNGKVACEPFVTNSVEKEIRNGIAIPKQRGTVTQLRVVMTSPGKETVFAVGDRIYLRAEQFHLNWAKEVFEVNGVKFILVPESEVLLRESN